MSRCPYSGLSVLSCKVSDLCDCFNFPEADERAMEIIRRRDEEIIRRRDEMDIADNM